MSLGRRLWEVVLEIDRFIRMHFVGFATVWCVLAAATAAGRLGPLELIPVLLAALCYHVYAYVLNDVVDLPVDRTHPDRQRDPLVRGAVRPGTALGFALLQVPLGFGVLWAVGAAPFAWAALGAGFLLMTIYDVWGKRCPVPPLTDLAQGLGWGTLAYVGAGLVADEPSALTHLLFAYGAGHILLINGIHGGIRDLGNDLARGSLTTAAFLGARPEAGAVRSTRGVLVFTLVLQLGLAVLLVWPVWAGAYGHPSGLQVVARLLSLALAAGLCFLAVRVARPELPGWDASMRIHLFAIPFSLILLFLPVVGAPIATLVLVLYVLPTVTLDFTRQFFARLLGIGAERRLSVAVPGGEEKGAP
jgi:4-hydroxybenzoate polyprenyltransferase